MRFVYIDSQGREVPIPTLEALALRIELGAITEGTRFYDAAADRWAPASEHEIFRSITRELEDKSGGFVAPPPGVPASSPPAPSRESVVEDPPADPEPEPEASPVSEAADEPPARAEPDDELGGLDFGLTMATDLTDPPASDPSDSNMTGLETSPEKSIEQDEAPLEPVVSESDLLGEDDFGGFGGLLSDDGWDGDEDEEGVEGDLELQGVTEGASYEAPSQEDGMGGMDLEQPLADLPLDEGDWMESESAHEEVSEADPSPSPEPPSDGYEEEPEPSPRARPTPRPEKKKSSGVPALLLLSTVVLLLVGGGWFGWNSFRNRQAAPPTAPEEIDPPVAIPAIPAELEPQLLAVVAAAKTDWLSALRTQMPSERGLPVEPAREWLGGSYLADASLHASIGEYWGALSGYLADARAQEEEMFVSFFRSRLDSAAVTGPDAETLVNRGRAGFQAARPDRRVVYRRLAAVIDAASGLHEFLLTNEDQIEFDPAAGGASRDPVLEAVPATPELGAAMWDQVDQITESLDGLGALDRVTTERLLDLFVDQMSAVEIR